MIAKSLPRNKQDAFLGSSLYGQFSVEDWEEDDLAKFLFGSGTVDAWCPNCKRESVFRIVSQLAGYNEPEKKVPHRGVIEIQAVCARGLEDAFSGCRAPLVVVFYKDSSLLRKIGQLPSAADLAFGRLDEAFNKELDAAARHELGTAIGLHAHGVGIGAFVYLRRIFENLLEEAHQQVLQEPSWDEPAYAKARTNERIRLLHAHLPPRLVAAADLYGVLSLGIHELAEEHCLDSFELVQSAIAMILKEKAEDKRYKSVVKAMQRAR